MIAPVKPKVFEAMMNLDIDGLAKFTDNEIRPVLPGLIRMGLCSSFDDTPIGNSLRKRILTRLSAIEIVNNIVGLLSIDFNVLEQDLKKEQQLREKAGCEADSFLAQRMTKGIVLEFEHGDASRRMRLMLSQLLFIVSQLKESKVDNYDKPSELFESEIHLDEIGDILCITCADKNSMSYTMSQRYTVEQRSMPALAVALSLQMATASSSSTPSFLHGVDDVLTFLSSLLLGNDPSVRSWFAGFVKVAQKRQSKTRDGESVLQKLRSYLLLHLQSFIPDAGGTLSESVVIRASSLIRLYCALKGIATLKYSDDEVKFLFQLLTSQPPLTPAGTRFVTLALCFIISNSNLLCGFDEEQKMVAWVKRMLPDNHSLGNSREAVDGKTSRDMFFLVALHFHSNQTSAISDLVCNTLGIKSIVKAGSLSRLRTIFTQDIFSEQVLASEAVTLPVTHCLTAGHVDYLPLHSIHQLLKTRFFSRHKAPIKDWILRQLKESDLPLHPLLPQLIECFVASLLPKSPTAECCSEPFSEYEVVSTFQNFLCWRDCVDAVETVSGSCRSSEGGGDNIAPKILMLYYILHYQDTLHGLVKSSGVATVRPCSPYKESVIARLPISYLVQEAQRRYQDCSCVCPSLLRLLVTHFPHLCLVEDWLEDSLPTPGVADSLPVSLVTIPSVHGVQDSFQAAIRSAVDNPVPALIHLTSVLRLTSLDLVVHSDSIVDCLPALLGDRVPRRVSDLACRLWFRCHSMIPCRMRLATINALCPTAARSNARLFSEQNVVVDPLIVLRCDGRVFRCPPVLSVILRILSAYTQASRMFLHKQVANGNGLPSFQVTGKTEADRQELVSALVAAQESACLQILLDACRPSQQEKTGWVFVTSFSRYYPHHGLAEKSGELSCLREVRCVIYSYLHRAFIQDPYLAKLVHFQGYPSELLPGVVAGVPSMHICLDFIPELLGQPQVEKQVFGIQLLAAICGRYTLERTLNVAQLAVNLLFTFLSSYESGVMPAAFQDILPCLELMCEAFPPLCEDVTCLLLQLGRVCRTNVAVTGCPILSGTGGVDITRPCGVKDGCEEDITVSCYHNLQILVQNTFHKIALISSASGRT